MTMDRSYRDAQTIKLFTRCYEQAYYARRDQIETPSPFFSGGNLTDPWTVFQDIYEGKVWKHMGILPTWKSRPVTEKAFALVEGNTTRLTDNRPKCMFLPRESGDYETARVIQAYFDLWHDLSGFAAALYLAVKDSRKYGLGWLDLEWDPATKKQAIHARHPETIMVDPDCTADSYDPAWVIFEYIAQVGDLKAAYPNADWDHFNHKSIISGATSFIGRILQRFTGNYTDNNENPAKSAVVYELFIRDPETVEWDVDVSGTDLQVTKRKKKYPGGRIVTIAGGIVLDDRPNPYKHGEVRFTPIHAYPESGKFYGRGDIAVLMNNVILMSRVMQYLFDATFKATGGIYLVNKRFGMSKSSVTNDPVQVREVSDVNQALRVVQPASPPRHLFDFFGMLSKEGDDAGGNHDISRGTYTPGNKTMAEVQILSESDLTRVRMAARWVAAAIERVGRQWLSNAAQFEGWSAMVRVAGDDGTEKSVQVNPSTFRAAEYSDETGEVVDYDTLILDVKVADSSMLPLTQQQNRQEVMQLRQMGVVDDEETLKRLDWPDWQNYIARRKAEAAAAPPQGPPQGPPQEAPTGPPQEGSILDSVPPEFIQSLPPEMQQLPPEMLEALLAQAGGVI